jgi:hypothetical protein
MRRLALTAALLSSSACGDDDASVRIGTGYDGFTVLADGDPIDVNAGPQGGFHVFGSIQARGISPGDPEKLAADDNPSTRFSVWRDGARVDSNVATFQQGYADAGDGVYELIGRLVVLDIAGVSDLVDVELRFDVEVTGAGGAEARDSVVVVGRPGLVAREGALTDRDS